MEQIELCFIRNIADKNNDGKFDISELQRLFKQINLMISKDSILKLCNGKKHLNQQEFVAIFKKLKGNSVMKQLFNHLAAGSSVLPKSKFQEFLLLEQKDNLPAKDLSFEDFVEYLSNHNSRAYDCNSTKLTMDMGKPWTEYYMNSSHNTYLIGDQLQGQSSVLGYRNALLLGCRCVELDCWDGEDGEPIIYHGYNVLETIRNDAFTASPYPVVISLEVHCSIEQQEKMAALLVEILNDYLLLHPLEGVVSPEALKYKIIIKGKANKSTNSEINAEADENSESDNEIEVSEPIAKSKTLKKRLDITTGKKDSTTSKTAFALGELVVYQQSRSIKTLNDIAGAGFKNVASFSESRMNKLISKGFNQILDLNKKSFSRIFPQGGRVDSSNLNPVHFWRTGCQITALNYQTFDKGMRLNRGFFLQNGNSGYILKPDSIYNNGAKHSKLSITVTVYSGYLLPKPENRAKGEIVDPFVVCSLILPNENLNQEPIEESFRTEAIEDNGFNPVWNDFSNPKSFKFSNNVKIRELSFLSLTVRDKDLISNDFLANSVIPINCLKNGYRLVTLFDHNGHAIPFAQLFIRIQMEERK